MSRESVGRTLGVALVVCLCCSIVVSATAVGLRELQLANRVADRKEKILEAAGLAEGDVQEAFASIRPLVVDIDSGRPRDDLDPDIYDPLRAARDPGESIPLAPEIDIAVLKRREKATTLYVKESTGGGIEILVLPVRGYGLWGTLYGYLALEGDLQTIAGLAFYEHKETPGLGGEVDNPRWRGLWPGKRVFDARGGVAIKVIKGRVNPTAPGAIHQVDGLAGATLTSRGVSRMMQFWLGPRGYGPLLDGLRSKRIQLSPKTPGSRQSGYRKLSSEANHG